MLYVESIFIWYMTGVGLLSECTIMPVEDFINSIASVYLFHGGLNKSMKMCLKVKGFHFSIELENHLYL